METGMQAEVAPLVAFLMLCLSVSGCLGVDLLPPEHERDDEAYVFQLEPIDESNATSQPVYDYREMNGSEREILTEILRDGEYEHCTLGGVPKSVARLETKFRHRSGVLLHDGEYYRIQVEKWTHMC